MTDESTLVPQSRIGRLVTDDENASERAVLQVFLPEHTRRVALEPGRDLVVGRAEDVDLRLPDPSVSRRHAIFRWKAGALWLHDEGSSNGTFVNTREIERTQVRIGDRIEFGAIVVAVRSSGERAPARLVAYEDLEPLVGAALAEARRRESSAALLMLRATGGDRHLSAWLFCVERALRETDAIASFGTESLLALMPDADAAHAERVAAAITSSSAARVAGVVGSVVSYPGSASRADELIAEAARLLAEKSDAQAASVNASRLGDDTILHSDALRSVYDLAARVAKSDATALIRGETGTGKELVAEFIHRNSRRAGGALVRVNCGAIAPTLLESTLFGHERGAFTGAESSRPGLFERADGGTLFLDEVGELSPAAQAALLRALETGTVIRVGGVQETRFDARILAATHRDLGDMAKQGLFRLDLYYRLNTIAIEIPPLRERIAEIVPLAEHFIARANRAHDRNVRGLTAGAIELLERYEWPGNVRELRNAMERAVVMARRDRIDVGELPPTLTSLGETTDIFQLDGADLPFKERIQRFERRLMMEALRECGGNKTAAARRLNMPLRTFMHKCTTYGLDADE